jgi:hypothetical protein
LCSSIFSFVSLISSAILASFLGVLITSSSSTLGEIGVESSILGVVLFGFIISGVFEISHFT